MLRYSITRYHAGQVMTHETAKTCYGAADEFVSAVWHMIECEALLDRQIGHDVMNRAKAMARDVEENGLKACRIFLTEKDTRRGSVILSVI